MVVDVSLKSWLKHAFAVNSETAPPTEEEMRIVKRIAMEVVRRGMAVPGLAFLEMVRPLNYVGAQTMQFFLPVVTAVTNAAEYQTFANFLQRRESIDILCEQIELEEQSANSRRTDEQESAETFNETAHG